MLLSTMEAGILVTGGGQGRVEQRENKVDGSSVRVVTRACMLAPGFLTTYKYCLLLMQTSLIDRILRDASSHPQKMLEPRRIFEEHH